MFLISGVHYISNLRFADDTLLIASNEEELKALLDLLETISMEYGLLINVRKTKVMIIDRANNNCPEKRTVAKYDVVDHFIYLGALINNKGCCEAEIRRRIQLGRTAMSQLENMEKSWYYQKYQNKLS